MNVKALTLFATRLASIVIALASLAFLPAPIWAVVGWLFIAAFIIGIILSAHQNAFGISLAFTGTIGTAPVFKLGLDSDIGPATGLADKFQLALLVLIGGLTLVIAEVIPDIYSRLWPEQKGTAMSTGNECLFANDRAPSAFVCTLLRARPGSAIGAIDSEFLTANLTRLHEVALDISIGLRGIAAKTGAIPRPPQGAFWGNSRYVGLSALLTDFFNFHDCLSREASRWFELHCCLGNAATNGMRESQV